MTQENAVRGYLNAVLFAETPMRDDDGDDPQRDSSAKDDGFGIGSFTDAAVARVRRIVAAFYADVEAQPSGAEILSRYADDEIGKDLYFTSSRHGCGFWDGDYADDDGELLTAAADRQPEENHVLVVTVDGEERLEFLTD